MSDESLYRLAGFVNPAGNFPGFAIPLFEKNGAVYTQDGRLDGAISGFLTFTDNAIVSSVQTRDSLVLVLPADSNGQSCHCLDPSMLVCGDASLSVSRDESQPASPRVKIGEPVRFAFAVSKTEVLYSNRDGLRRMLASSSWDHASWFVIAEIAEFLQDRPLYERAINEAAAQMAQRNSKTAAQWQKMMLRNNDTRFSKSDDDLKYIFASPDEAAARAAMDELLRRGEGQFRAASIRMSGGNRQEAEDLYGDATTKVWEKRSAYKPLAVPWIAWAIAVMGGCASGRRRHRRGQVQSNIEYNSSVTEWMCREDSAGLEVERKELQRSVKDCLGRLEEEQQAVVVLHLYLGLTFRRITELLNLGDGPTPAWSRYDRAIKQLKRCTVSKGYGVEDLSQC